MQRNKSIWFARRTSDDNAEVQTYNEPIEIVIRCNFLTVMSASSRGYTETRKYGETLFDTWTVIANAKMFDGFFNVGDLMYVDGEEPDNGIESRYGNGSSANAVVVKVVPVNRSISVVLERNQKQVKE